MSTIIETHCNHHLGDNIINFIFFYKLKDYIEANNIIIHYYCGSEYNDNLLDFKCSENIKIFNHEQRGFSFWQSHVHEHTNCIEDKLCRMFNIFLERYKIPISVNSFEYKDDDLLKRYECLSDIHKNINILVINSTPRSSQYIYNKPRWDYFITKLSDKYIVATTEKVNDSIISLHEMSVKNIAAIALKVKIVIAINTGPFIPLFNTDILNNVDVIYVFGGGYIQKTRKMHPKNYIEELSFLL
jgi:hypothetical protein